MSLQAKLDEYKANFRKTAPQEVLERMHRATEDLRNSGIVECALKINDRAPHFTLENAASQRVSSQEILSQRFMILTFYRGRW